MRRINVFLFLSVIVFSFLMYGCGDSGGGGGSSHDNTDGNYTIYSANITGNAPTNGTIKMEINGQFYRNIPYSSGTMPNIILPKPAPSHLVLIKTTYQSLNLSDDTVRLAYLSLVIEDEYLEAYTGNYQGNNNDVIYMFTYVDKDVSIQGNYTSTKDGVNSKFVYNNCNLTQGWNVLKLKYNSNASTPPNDLQYEFDTKTNSDVFVWYYE